MNQILRLDGAPEIPMHGGEVPREGTAVLVVDMQRGFFDDRSSLGAALNLMRRTLHRQG